MTRSTRNRSTAKPGKFLRWRRTIALFAVFAFAAQSYVVQTHVHIPAFEQIASDSSGHEVSPAVTRSHDVDHQRGPLKDDPAHCPFCQEMLYAGTYAMPAAPMVLAPVESNPQPVSPVPVSLGITSVSHDWRGRAPPFALGSASALSG
ncbi:MAG TPA: DUF2946 family protein [Rhizomicrobium sp.]|nr:DUF2946 family protein [Rhizomicrobium sp.]